MMIAVAIIAIALGAGIEAVRLKRFRDHFVRKATEHTGWEKMYSNIEKNGREVAALNEVHIANTLRWLELQKVHARGTLPRATEDRIEKMTEEVRASIETSKEDAVKERARLAKFLKYAAHHAALKQKYLRASHRPWRSVEPDPPPLEPNALGAYWEQREDYHAARAAYEEALRDEHENATPLNNLAWILSTCPVATLRDGKRAVELAKRACELTERKDVGFLDTLAAAFAETGDFKAAVETQREALALLPKGNPVEAQYHGRLEGYEANKPFRQGITNAR
jgi:tetratricopeptide (TPR) repeat protein